MKPPVLELRPIGRYGPKGVGCQSTFRVFVRCLSSICNWGGYRTAKVNYPAAWEGPPPANQLQFKGLRGMEGGCCAKCHSETHILYATREI